MKTYKWEEFVEWVFEQPDDREVDMISGRVTTHNSKCCVLAQFFRERRCRIGSVDMGGRFYTPFFWREAEVELPHPNIFFCFDGWSMSKNFGELKKSIRI
jgi:hypothetical protein